MVAVNFEKKDGNYQLINALRQMGIVHYSGVNGGGIIHVTKYLQPLRNLQEASDLTTPRLITLGEYASGFVPLGHYLGSGKIACAISTTGAAIKLTSCGLSDAKVHNIPALYLIALNSLASIGKAPLQDVSEHGMNIVPQLVAELGEGCVVIDNLEDLPQKLIQVNSTLKQHRPAAIAFHPDVLSRAAEEILLPAPKEESQVGPIEPFIAAINKLPNNKRIIIFIGEEAAFYPKIQGLSTQLATLLHAPTVWSVNGANAVAPDNPYGYGYIMFGGNDEALKLWHTLNEEDFVITLGFCPGEYVLNLTGIPAGQVWHFGNYPQAYGQINGNFGYRCLGSYHYVKGDIAKTLEKIIKALQACQIERRRPVIKQLTNFNSRIIKRVTNKHYVDIVTFYEQLQRYWQPNSIGFDDVCTSYKDRQYVTQRPHPHIKFWTLYQGSAMGGAFGLGIGAKLGNPHLHTFIFSGDGCWRLFGGCLADVANLGLRLFIMNNGTYALIAKGLELIIPQVVTSLYHSQLASIDFVGAARAHGWDSYLLQADLSNLPEIMAACYSPSSKSLLVEVPIDPEQLVGLNSRLRNLTKEFYL